MKISTLLTVLVALLLACQAGATGRNDPDPSQEQQQGQGQHQGQGQGQHQGQETDVDVDLEVTTEATIAEGAVKIENVREAQGDYKVDFRNNPNVYSNPPNATINCYKTGSGGASGGGFALSLGGGKIDPYCVEREEIRLADMIGLNFQAVWRWCSMENNVRVFGSAEECLQADTSLLSDNYRALLSDRNRLEKELRETQTIMAARCAAAEESAERSNEAWLACQKK